VNTKYLKYKKDTDKYAYANFGQDPNIPNKDYTVEVNLNDDVIWVGESSSSPGIDTVFIKEIRFKKGKKILNEDILREEKEVRGKVDKGKMGDQESYFISFAFHSKTNPQNNKIFQIDPILRII
jgi:predicted RNA-binding protein